MAGIDSEFAELEERCLVVVVWASAVAGGNVFAAGAAAAVPVADAAVVEAGEEQ